MPLELIIEERGAPSARPGRAGRHRLRGPARGLRRRPALLVRLRAPRADPGAGGHRPRGGPRAARTACSSTGKRSRPSSRGPCSPRTSSRSRRSSIRARVAEPDVAGPRGHLPRGPHPLDRGSAPRAPAPRRRSRGPRPPPPPARPGAPRVPLPPDASRSAVLRRTDRGERAQRATAAVPLPPPSLPETLRATRAPERAAAGVSRAARRERLVPAWSDSSCSPSSSAGSASSPCSAGSPCCCWCCSHERQPPPAPGAAPGRPRPRRARGPDRRRVDPRPPRGLAARPRRAVGVAPARAGLLRGRRRLPRGPRLAERDLGGRPPGAGRRGPARRQRRAPRPVHQPDAAPPPLRGPGGAAARRPHRGAGPADRPHSGARRRSSRPPRSSPAPSRPPRRRRSRTPGRGSGRSRSPRAPRRPSPPRPSPSSSPRSPRPPALARRLGGRIGPKALGIAALALIAVAVVPLRSRRAAEALAVGPGRAGPHPRRGARGPAGQRGGPGVVAQDHGRRPGGHDRRDAARPDRLHRAAAARGGGRACARWCSGSSARGIVLVRQNLHYETTPHVSALEPAEAEVGSVVTLRGSGFSSQAGGCPSASARPRPGWSRCSRTASGSAFPVVTRSAPRGGPRRGEGRRVVVASPSRCGCRPARRPA